MKRVIPRFKASDSMLRIKRVYENAQANDGIGLLVDRLWRRGIKKENLKMKGWLKDVAPSPELRKWSSHDLKKWAAFEKRYRAGLTSNKGVCKRNPRGGEDWSCYAALQCQRYRTQQRYLAPGIFGKAAEIDGLAEKPKTGENQTSPHT